MSTCATVLADAMGYVYVGVVVGAAMIAGLVSGLVRIAERRSRLRRFFAAFRQMSSIVVVVGRVKLKADSNRTLDRSLCYVCGSG